MAKITPMMQQYMDIKDKYKDCILFYRLGDFYEMFFDDALLASKELEITLTGRNCGTEERAPMCGVPYHAAQTYISRLINKGFKVAICEQVETPEEAKGIVKREVVKIITPGTITDLSMLDDKKNNYLMCVYNRKTYFGIAAVDISTGEFLTTQISVGNTLKKLEDEIARFAPSEILLNQKLSENKEFVNILKERLGAYISTSDESLFNRGNAKSKINEYAMNDFNINNELALIASGALLAYIEDTQKSTILHIKEIEEYKLESFMILDSATRRNLEITESMRDRRKKGTLLWVLDKTMTAMGGRCLRRWLEQPLLNITEIQSRHNAVEELKDKFMVRSELRELLRLVYDMERLATKISMGTVNARDLVSLKISLGQIPYIKEVYSQCLSELNKECLERLDALQDIYELIDHAIIDEPPLVITEGGIIKDNYNEEIDTLKHASQDGKTWLVELEKTERDRTGIKTLKIKFNKVFGYYLEVTKSYFNLVPDNYVRKQTLANCERYIIDELKQLENKILGAEDQLIKLEYAYFCDIRNTISEEIFRIRMTANSLAELDALCSFAEVSDRENYCKPNMTEDSIIDIKNGRHPVIERTLMDSDFVPNDTLLDGKVNRFAIITGPNMAGKSTYMRQVALISLIAQSGCFVPAEEAVLGITDRVFTRVGASDDLALGHSTFMVEMTEVANILENATPKSLLILDEIGRGTSTFDGLSIAWAVIEYINDIRRLGARTLFATHYHELTELENKMHGINNYCILVKKKGEDIKFLRKIVRGGADESYGIEVARLAGVPKQVIERANAILNELEESDIVKSGKRAKKKKPIDGQIDLFTASAISREEKEVIGELRNIEPTELTPLDALNLLYKLNKKLKQ